MFRKTAQPQPATTDPAIDTDDLLMIMTIVTPADGSHPYKEGIARSLRLSLAGDEPLPHFGVQDNGDVTSHEFFSFMTYTDATGQQSIFMLDHGNDAPQLREIFSPDEFAAFVDVAKQRQPTSRHAQPLIVIPHEPIPSHIDPAVAAGFAALTNPRG